MEITKFFEMNQTMTRKTELTKLAERATILRQQLDFGYINFHDVRNFLTEVITITDFPERKTTEKDERFLKALKYILESGAKRRARQK